MHFSLYRKAMLAAVDSNQLEMPYSATLTDATAAASRYRKKVGLGKWVANSL